MVGRFAGTLADARDHRTNAGAAIAQARHTLADNAVVTKDVADAIAREVYDHPALTPAAATEVVRQRCLAVNGLPASASAPPQPQQQPLRPEGIAARQQLAEAPSSQPVNLMPPPGVLNEAAITRAVPPPDRVPAAWNEAAPPGGPSITLLHSIALHRGENRIAGFTPAGEMGIVQLSWQDDPNGGGHDVFTVFIPDAGAVGMPDGTSVSDDPLHDDDMLRSVRFAHGLLNGAPATLLLMADRRPGAGPTPTTYRVYALTRADGSAPYFALVEQRVLPGTFCNADAALTAASGLPLRISYRGAPTADGCPMMAMR